MTAILDVDFTIDLIIYAIEKNQENELFEMWKLQYPSMDKETFISFEDYKDKLIKSKKSTRISYVDIEKEMQMVMNKHEGR